MSLLSIVAHFIDKGGKLQSVLLGLLQLWRLHSAENITTALASVIQKYQFDYKLGSLMADNTSNNNKLYNYLSQSLSVAKKEQLWYISHIINLIIKALIYGKGISLNA